MCCVMAAQARTPRQPPAAPCRSASRRRRRSSTAPAATRSLDYPPSPFNVAGLSHRQSSTLLTLHAGSAPKPSDLLQEGAASGRRRRSQTDRLRQPTQVLSDVVEQVEDVARGAPLGEQRLALKGSGNGKGPEVRRKLRVGHPGLEVEGGRSPHALCQAATWSCHSCAVAPSVMRRLRRVLVVVTISSETPRSMCSSRSCRSGVRRAASSPLRAPVSAARRSSRWTCSA